MASKWAVDERREAEKLRPKESDWKLAGSGDGEELGRGKRKHAARTYLGDSSSSDDSSFVASSSSSDQSNAAWQKPSATRLILESDPLRKLIEEHAKCPSCKQLLECVFETVTITSTVHLKCNNCTYIKEAEAPQPAKLPQFTDERERMTDYALNCLCVLAIIASGSGKKEGARILGLLGLPNDTTMETRSFGIIEERMAPIIWALHEEIMSENLSSEVRLSTNKADFFLWKESFTRTDLTLPTAKYPQLAVSFDTGWNQRSKLYNSPSSHSFMVGKNTRLPICGEIKSKLCSYCSSWNKRQSKLPRDQQLPAPEHFCVRNFEGSSGSMEPKAAVDMVSRLWNKSKCAAQWICMDDDASTRAALSWSNADYKKNYNTDVLPQVPITKGKNKGKLQDRPDKGILPGHTQQPKDVADPNHRRKLWTGDLLALEARKKKDSFTMTKMDAQRLGKNMGYMIKSLNGMDESLYCVSAMAVLEHHFDNHDYCGNWCPRKKMTTEQKEASSRYYRSKDKDAELCDELSKLIQRFITFDRLKEVAHGMDTNVNESINNTISYFAPKNRVYCTTRSLHNRVAIAIGILSLGFVPYFERLFKALGTQLTDNVRHFLQLKEKQRMHRQKQQKKSEQKKLRNQRKFERLKELESKAKIASQKSEGTHQPGINMDGVEEEKTAPKKNKQKICPLCNKKGHLTKRSKHCLYNPLNPNYKGEANVAPVEPLSSTTEAQINDINAAADIDALESLPFTDELPGMDFEDQDEFHDCGTWSEDEDANEIVTGIL